MDCRNTREIVFQIWKKRFGPSIFVYPFMSGKYLQLDNRYFILFSGTQEGKLYNVAFYVTWLVMSRHFRSDGPVFQKL